MKENDNRLNAYKKVSEFKPRQISKNDAASGVKDASAGERKDPAPQIQAFTPRSLADFSSKKTDKNTVQNEVPKNTINDYIDRRGLIKVAVTPLEGGKDSLYRRVAKFLVLIGVDEAAKILPHLTSEQTEKIIPEIASIRRVDPDEASVILAEFENLVQRARESGGVTTARSILERAFGSERASKMIQKTVSFPEGKPFDYLQEASGERVYQLLKGESPAVSALVLSHIKSAAAAEVITFEHIINSEQLVTQFPAEFGI